MKLVYAALGAAALVMLLTGPLKVHGALDPNPVVDEKFDPLDPECFTDTCVFAQCERDKGRPCSDLEVFGPDEEDDDEECPPQDCREFSGAARHWQVYRGLT